MEPLLYLAKVGLIYAALYIIYYFLFRNNTNFRTNRIYLLAIVPIAFILPFINQSVEVATSYQVVLPIIEIGNLSTDSNAFDWSSLLINAYAAVAGILLLVLITNLSKTLQVISKIKQGKYDGIKPFSFFSFIYVPDNINEEDRTAIIHHERVHSTQLHSLDIIIYELSKILLWWNPLIWMGLNSVKSNHEFIADELASEKNDKYSSVLVAQLLGVNCSVLTNNFSYEPFIKKRIMMMKMKKSNRLSVFKYTLVIPVVALTIVATAQKKGDAPVPKIAPPAPEAPAVADGPAVPSVPAAPAPERSGASKVPDVPSVPEVPKETTPNNQDKVYDKVDVMPEFKGGMDGMMKFIQTEVKYPEEAKKSGISGMVYVGFIIDSKGAIKEVSVLKSAGELLDKEAIRVVKKMPKWKPGEKDGKKVSVKFTLPISFKI